METEALERLRAFRQIIYTTFGGRRDALAEMLDALLTSPVIEHPVHLSLAPGFQRAWGSVYEAQKAGTMSLSRWEQVVAAHPLETTTAWYAVDASLWPRNDAETSAERGYDDHRSPHSHDESILAGWNDSWLVQRALRCSSWTAPLRVRRIQPGENVNQVAAEQIRSFLRQRGAGKPCPPFTFDAGYDPVPLGVALAGEEGGVLLRLRREADLLDRSTTGTDRRTATSPWDEVRRCRRERPGPLLRLSARPRMPPMGGCGGSRGADSILSPTCTPSGAHGNLARSSAGRSSGERWSISSTPPKRLGHSGSGGGDRTRRIYQRVFRVYVARFSIEHPVRFCKHVLNWTTPQVRAPEAADRWTWLVMLADVQLRLARPLVVDQRLPWQTPLPTEKLTPARVRRAFSHLLPLLFRMATAPTPCGRSPGRPKGRKSTPAQRFPVIKVTA